MEMFRVLTGATGRSRLEDIKSPFEEGPAQPNPRFLKATNVRFNRSEGEQTYDWHNVRERTVFVVLSGRMEVQTGDGNVKVNLAPGDIFWTGDLTGQGHQARSRGDRRLMSIAVPDWEPEGGPLGLPEVPRIPPGQKMRGDQVLRIHTGPDGKTHFQDVSGLSAQAGVTIPVEGVRFSRTTGDTFSDWHNAPRRQLLVICSGELEIEVGSGEKRVLTAGDVLVAEDLTGQGHITRGRGDRRTVTIPLAQNAVVPV